MSFLENNHYKCTDRVEEEIRAQGQPSLSKQLGRRKKTKIWIKIEPKRTLI